MECNSSFEKPVLESIFSLELIKVLNSLAVSIVGPKSCCCSYLLFSESCLPKTGLKTALVVNQV